MPLQGGLLLAALPNLYLNESPVNYVTDGNALSTYLISQESQRMDQTLMAIQTKFTIATFIGDEKMFREAVFNANSRASRVFSRLPRVF